MTNKPLTPNPEHPETQIFSDTDISVNGQNYNNLNELPPELKEDVIAAFTKMQSNPNLANIFSSIGDIVKSAKQNGIGVSTIKSADHAKLKTLLEQHVARKESLVSDKAAVGTISNASPTPTPFESDQFLRPANRNSPIPSATYNPMVKGDGLRKAVFVAAVILVVGYLIVKFGYNGKLPF